MKTSAKNSLIQVLKIIGIIFAAVLLVYTLIPGLYVSLALFFGFFAVILRYVVYAALGILAVVLIVRLIKKMK